MISILPILFLLIPVIFIGYFIYKLVQSGSTMSEKEVMSFIATNLISMNAQQFINQPKLANFRSLVASGKTIAAMKEYHEVMNSSMAQSRLAVSLCKQLTR
jgi:hypothetical protein